MNLPKISTPIYEVKLMSIDKPVQFRPFLVKEQKLMMMAVESKDPMEAVKTMKQIATNCILDKIDVDSLPLVDIEILFLNFRARSMGEVMNVYYKCKNDIVDENNNKKECGMVIDVDVNLLEVPIKNQNVETKIMITEDIGIQMKLPTFEFINKLLSDNVPKLDDEDDSVYTAAMCVDYVFDKESVYYAKDCTAEEMMNFLYSLPPDKYTKIENYFENLPTVRKEMDAECPKCGFKHNFVLEGLNDFFI
jgi:T4 bacteriophage base plate protein